MKPERWQRINQLYHSAVELETNERASFLEQASRGDEELRREVEALLAENEQAGSFVIPPAAEVGVASDQVTAPPARRLGEYQILSLLGQGGMGQVYLAQDMRLGRKIALKLFPKEFTQDRERLRRLEQEAKAASALNHPNIITIYETQEFEGQRFIVTEFIDGQVDELNRRYGSPLQNRADLARFYRLVGGHPYLVRCGLHEMVVHGLHVPALEGLADHDEGPFGDHLRRMLLSLTQDASLCEVVRGVVQGQPCPTPESFYRLRSAGLMSGESAQFVKPRCQLYATYLERHLL